MTRIRTVSGQVYVVREDVELVRNVLRTSYQQMEPADFTLQLDGSLVSFIAMNVEAVLRDE